jgi:hypothetical protein
MIKKIVNFGNSSDLWENVVWHWWNNVCIKQAYLKLSK